MPTTQPRAVGSKPNFFAKVNGSAHEIYVYDEIGPAEWGLISAQLIVDEIKAAKAAKASSISLRINSPGGSVFQALGIYSSLKESGLPVNVFVDGVALSAASLIAMAGDVIAIAEAGFMLIHNARAYAAGESKDLREAADSLDMMSTQLAGIYSARSGISLDEIKVMMSDGAYITAQKAIELKLATSLMPNKQVAACGGIELLDDAPQELVTKISAFFKEQKMLDPVAAANPSDPFTAPVASASVASAAAPVAPPTPAPSPLAAAADPVAAERSRVAEIVAMCNEVGQPQLAEKFIADGTAVDAARKAVLSAVIAANARPAGGESPKIIAGVAGATASASPKMAEAKQSWESHKSDLALICSEEEYIKAYVAESAPCAGRYKF